MAEPMNFTYDVVANQTTVNGSNEGDDNMAMLDVYYTRLTPYTVFAASCFAFNVLSIGAIMNIRGHRTVHHVLLLNLSTCDMVGSLLLWSYYNSPIIFPHFRITKLMHCIFKMLVLVGPFIVSLCNSFFSLLMLAINQYMAICSPLWSATHVTKGRAGICIICAWTLSIVLAATPALLMLALTTRHKCQTLSDVIGQMSLEICAYGMAGLIIIIVALYARVYGRVLRYRREQSQIRRNRQGHDSESNFNAFITTAILTGMLVLFWLPFMVMHFISAHFDINHIPDWVLLAKFYVIDLLPLLNFLTDPIVYGIRMKEIRAGYHRMFSRLLPCCVKPAGNPGNQNGAVRSSVRFTTLNTTPI